MKRTLPFSAVMFLTLGIAQWMTAIASAAPFEFKGGDRVVLLGGTLIEREQKFGLLESQLALANGSKKISVRNLGWSGDTVYGHARSYFGPPAEGLERLSKHLELVMPTVLITCYGSDVPFEGLDKLPDFIAGYGALLDLARSKSPGLRIIIVAPPPFENLGAPLPDLSDANAKLASVRDALRDFAAKQHATFVDSYEFMGGAKKERPAHPLTDNGLHYGEAGYRLWTAKLITALGLNVPPVSDSQMSSLRKLVVEKDRLFFNRWRPENETYLFGFRKHEQGRNAVEIEEFDPLIKAEEGKIAELKSTILAGTKLP